MSLHYSDDLVTLHHGDCLDVLATLADDSVDAVVTDPPYGLGFMGKEWDDLPPGEPWARECLRVLKPGGHLVAFGGTRTSHRLACAIEDAGFELRDTIAWLYGSGFPKSLDVSKAIDRAAGAEREIVGTYRVPGDSDAGNAGQVICSSDDASSMFGVGTGLTSGRPVTAPTTEDAKRWGGWGTALKPAHEPIIVARKPPTGTVAANVLAYGTSALNIDGCRVVATPEDVAVQRARTGGVMGVSDGRSIYGAGKRLPAGNDLGRWPTNVVLDPDAAAALDAQTGTRASSGIYQGDGSRRPGSHATDFGGANRPASMYNDEGGASRFFPTFRYEAKAPTDERPCIGTVAHPTVKPLDLMRWLVRLVTPPGGVVLDTFAGSGTTAEACIVEGFRCIAIEREADYLPLVLARISKPIEPVMFGMESA